MPLIKIIIDYLLASTDSSDTVTLSEAFELLSAITKTTEQEIDIELFISLWRGFMESVNKDLFIKWLYRKK